jgi:hypothetical protein
LFSRGVILQAQAPRSSSSKSSFFSKLQALAPQASPNSHENTQGRKRRGDINVSNSPLVFSPLKIEREVERMRGRDRRRRDSHKSMAGKISARESEGKS